MKGMRFLTLILMVVMGLNVTFAKEPIYTEATQGIVVNADEPVFSIKLKSNPTTGYTWFLREYHPMFLEPLSHHVERAADKGMVGAPGFEVWTFRVKPAAFTVPQQSAIRFVYVRPWEVSSEPQQMVFQVSSVLGKSG